MNESCSLPGFKVRFAQRNHSPLAKPISDHLAGALVIRKDISPVRSTPDLADETFVAGDRGKRRFEVPLALFKDESPSKSGKRFIRPPDGSQEINLRGKKYIAPPVYNNDKEPLGNNWRHMPEPRSLKESNGLPSQHWTRKRVVYTPDGQHLARNAPSDEHEVDKQMTRKHRVPTAEHMRNGIPLAHQHPGDNTYKVPEHSTDFFVAGGLIPGSTIIQRDSAKPQFKRNEANTGKMESKPLEATYGKMQARLAKEYDINQVRSLTVGSSTKQNQPIPSWEERTGCWLVAPEDEAF